MGPASCRPHVTRAFLLSRIQAQTPPPKKIPTHLATRNLPSSCWRRDHHSVRPALCRGTVMPVPSEQCGHTERFGRALRALPPESQLLRGYRSHRGCLSWCNRVARRSNPSDKPRREECERFWYRCRTWPKPVPDLRPLRDRRASRSMREQP